jgi:hypothetical protein
MKRQITILILVWSTALGVWAFANPPAGTVGTTTGILTVDGSGNVGIATSTPVGALDVNGTTTMRSVLDMTGNKISNLATPVASTDAVPMSYFSTQIGSVSSSTTRLWGKGRPGVTVTSPATGQCTNSIAGRTIKISRSTYVATWDKSAAACPANWWVCTAAERDINGATAGFGKCPASGATMKQIVGGQLSSGGNPLLYDNIYVPAIPDNVTFETDIVWVSDVAVSQHVGKAVSATDGVTKDDLMFITAPVWCCSY